MSRALHVATTEKATLEILKSSFLHRDTLRQDPAIVDGIFQVWNALHKDEYSRISKEVYLAFYHRVCVALVPFISSEQALAMAGRDWDYDTEGKGELSYVQFLDSVFELADLHCARVDAKDYLMFLNQLRESIFRSATPTTPLGDQCPAEITMESFMPLILRPVEDVCVFNSTAMTVSLAEILRWSLKQLLVVKHAEMYPESQKSCRSELEKSNTPSYKPPRKRLVARNFEYSKDINLKANKLREDKWNELHSLVEKSSTTKSAKICVVGSALSGKTTLARHIAQHLEFQYLSRATILYSVFERYQATLPDETSEEGELTGEESGPQLSPEEKKAGEMLIQGQAIENATILKLLCQRLQELDQAGFGVVLDDITPKDLEDVISAIQIDFVITLELPPQDLHERAIGFKFDPSSGKLCSFRDQRTSAICHGRAPEEGGEEQEEGQEDAAEVALRQEKELSLYGLASKPPELPTPEAAAQEEEKTASEEQATEEEAEEQQELDEDEGSSQSLIPEIRAFPTVLPPIVQDSNLLGWPNFDLAGRKLQIEKEKAGVPMAKCHIAIDPTQSPTAMLQQALTRISGVCPDFSQLQPSLIAVKVPLDPSVADADTPTQLRWLLYGDIHATLTEAHAAYLPVDEPRTLSPWKTKCPVQLRDSGQLAKGFPSHAAVYCGYVFLMSSPEALDAFVAKPSYYTANEPNSAFPQKRIVLVAEPSPSGLKPLADLVQKFASHYNLTCINPFDLVMKDESQLELLQGGNEVENDQLIDISCNNLTELASLEQIRPNGWVLFGLHPSEALLAKLEAAEFCPTHVISLAFDPEASGLDVVGDEGPLSGSILDMSELKQKFLNDWDSFKQLLSEKAEVEVYDCVFEPEVDDILYSLRHVIDPFEPEIDTQELGHDQESDPLSPAEEIVRNTHGEMKHFCPVWWKTKGRLIPGKAEYKLFVNQKSYTFAGEDEMKAFEKNPTRFLPQTDEVGAAPVILVLGVTGSGKLSLVNMLRERYSAQAFDNFTLHNQLVRRRACAESLGEELQDEQVVCDVYQNQLTYAERRAKKKPVVCCAIPGIGIERHTPSNSVVDALIERNLLPSCVMTLNVSQEEIVARKMKKWKFQLPPVDDQDEIPPKPGSEEYLQLEQAAKDEYQALVAAQFESDTADIEYAVEAFRERGVNVLPAIDANGTLERVFQRLCSVILPLSDQRQSVFASPLTISRDQAQKLLSSGYAFLGQYGVYCPVMYACSRSLVSCTAWPVLYRRHIYFPSGQELQQEFVRDIVSYLPWRLSFNVPRYSRHRIVDTASACERHGCSLAIVGPPKSGRTSMAESLAEAEGLIYVSPEEAMRWVACCCGGTSLWKELHAIVDGKFPAKLRALALKKRIEAVDCKARGYVLDGFPNTEEDLQLSNEVGITPEILLALDAPVDVLLGRCEANVLLPDLVAWRKTFSELTKSYFSDFGCGSIKVLDASRSKWALVADAHRILKATQRKIELHHQNIASGKAGLVDEIRVPEKLLTKAQHRVVGLSCPVERQKKFTCLGSLDNRKFCAEYEGKFFFLSSAEAAKAFCERPITFLQNIPRVIDTVVDMRLGGFITAGNEVVPELSGYCPVTYKEGDGPEDWTSIKKGIASCAVSFKGATYCFTSELQKRKFMRQPSLYIGQTLPVKLPPLVAPPDISQLSGNLEQTMSHILNDALSYIGSNRMKYPSRSVVTSVVYQLGLWLKVNNTKNTKDREAYFRGLQEQYHNDCLLIDCILHHASVGSAVKGVRSVRETDENAEYQKQAARFDQLAESKKDPNLLNRFAQLDLRVFPRGSEPSSN